jgi:cysteinyl-tRNA synthetase
MIEQTLGLPIDIHGGGIDLVFPHHENERAQGVCATHEPVYADFWLHNGFLNFGEEKMSKSLGNVALAHDLLKAYPGEAIRWALLVGHYRAPLEWNGELIESAKTSLDRLYQTLRDVGRIAAENDVDLPEARDAGVDAILRELGFWEALDDDLNTPKAMSALFALSTAIQGELRLRDPNWQGIVDRREALVKAAEVMGFLAADPEQWFQGGVDEDLKGRINGLVAARDEARRAKDWPSADRIRAELAALNVEVMDGPAGATWRIKEQA